MSEAPLRVSARVVLLDAQDRVLLVQHPMLEPTDAFDSVWVSPGGGVEADETLEEAAARELLEEVGVADVELGPLLWLRRIVLTFNGYPQTFEENFFLGRIDTFDLVPHTNADADELIADIRWWTLDEINASSEYFAPRDLAKLLRPVLAGQMTPQPLLIVGE